MSLPPSRQRSKHGKLRSCGSPGWTRAWESAGRRLTEPVLYPFADGGEPHSFISRLTWPLPPAGRWSSSGNGQHSASTNPGPTSMCNSSSTQHSAASGYSRKTKADGQVLTRQPSLIRTSYRGQGPAPARRPELRIVNDRCSSGARCRPIAAWTRFDHPARPQAAERATAR